MLTTFLRSIGVGDEILTHVDQARFAFQRPVLFWVGLALLVPVGWFIYRRQRANLPSVPSRLRGALTATRIVVLAVLVFVLAGPYLRLDYRTERKPVVAFIYDQSGSMRLPAGPYASDERLAAIAAAAGREIPTGPLTPETRKALEAMTRAELVESITQTARQELFGSLAENFDVRVYAMARQPVPLAFDGGQTPPAELADAELGDGERGASHLGDAVLHVLEETAGQTVSGIVLFSDGRNTGGRSPAEAAKAASSAGAPVFTVPIGPSERLRDVSIVDLHTSGLVSVGDTARVAVTLESQGFEGKPVKVELREGETVLDSEELTLKGTEQQQIELLFEAKAPGARYLTVHVPPQAEEPEALHENNSDLAFVRVSDDKLRVLYIDGLPRWDFRFLKNALRRDHGLAGRNGDAADILVETEWRRLSADEQAAQIPATLDELSKYHAIILGDVSPELLTPELQQTLTEAVATRGVGLIVAAGAQHMPQAFDAEFRELLPVILRTSGSGVEAPAYQPFRIEISPEGLVHEAMRLYDNPARNADVWSQMPPYHWCAAVERPSAAAMVLAWNPDVEGGFGKLPLVAWHYAGQGKVVFVGTDATWLWRQNVGDRYFYKFWGQMLRFVGRRQGADAKPQNRLEARPLRARPGEQAELELLAFHEDGTARADERLSVTLTGPDAAQTLELAADRRTPGRYTGRFTPEQPGEYHIAWQPADGQTAVEARIRVLPSGDELRDPNPNRPLLEHLATTTGGETIDVTEIRSIPGKLKGQPTVTQVHRESTVWDNWLVLLVLSVVYSADVAIRRLTGLS